MHNNAGDSARLFHFIERGDGRQVSRELEQGVDPNQCDTSTGKTALHFAAGRAATTPEIVTLLLGHGAGVNDQDQTGCTPLHLAITAKVATALLVNGADTTIKSSEGYDALEYALNYNPATASAIEEWLGGGCMSKMFDPQIAQADEVDTELSVLDEQLKNEILTQLRTEVTRLDEEEWMFTPLGA
jgi:hypothetical protein